ncbi:hypothetical protein [Eggerthia catenaformis]|uniref:hypothetical protein n=1 Tax=Eggerthia catenaformis TaxID=31973 RepID=UPI00047A7CF0|nr:hypothetical protein [Eggerthia catenaformis]
MKNKKIIALAMAVIMLAGCSGKKKADTSKAKDTQAKIAQTETANQEEKKEETTAPQTNSGTSEKKPTTASSSSTSSSTSRKAETVKATSNKPSTASSSSSGKKASTPAKTSTPAKKPSTSSNKPASKPSKPSKPNKPSKPSKPATHTVTCVVWLKDDQTGKEYIIHKETATYTGDDDFAARNKASRAAATWGHNHADEYIEKYNIGSGNWGTRFQ